MENNIEEKILNAAREVFTRKGYAAARTQEIAETAGVNKGLLHYYKWNKKKLFKAVFYEVFNEFVGTVNQIFESDLPLLEKIESFVHNYMDILIANPHFPAFILNELNTNPEAFVEDIMSRKVRPNPMKLLLQIQVESQAGRIRPIHPFDLLLNTLSMCVFPFAARPFLQRIGQIDDRTYMEFMASRKEVIVDFIHQAIRIQD